MQSIFTHTYNSPLGEIILGDFEGKLVLADWKYRKMRSSIDKRIQDGCSTDYLENKTDLHQLCIQQFDEYFQNKRTTFDIPLLLIGSDFQKQVWNELLNIPFGKTSSYLALSQKLNNEKAIRAVASANGANAISIIIPCHRIIGSDGDLVGYAGGLSAKKKLLQLENSFNQLEMNF
jgi:methylated-DNA-[protein]-cysteine S-methyltransferase